MLIFYIFTTIFQPCRDETPLRRLLVSPCDFNLRVPAHLNLNKKKQQCTTNRGCTFPIRWIDICASIDLIKWVGYWQRCERSTSSTVASSAVLILVFSRLRLCSEPICIRISLSSVYSNSLYLRLLCTKTLCALRFHDNQQL